MSGGISLSLLPNGEVVTVLPTPMTDFAICSTGRVHECQEGSHDGRCLFVRKEAIEEIFECVHFNPKTGEPRKGCVVMEIKILRPEDP